MTTLDLKMLAADIAGMLDRYGYPLDATEDDILPALPAFVAELQANAARAGRWEDGEDAARWTSATSPADSPRPRPGTGRPPRMTYDPWRRTQGIDVGATAPADWHWRCPVCRAWSSGYGDVLAAKQDGMTHRNHRTTSRRPAAPKPERQHGGPPGT